jgi:rhamnogalacturonan endolyase
MKKHLYFLITFLSLTGISVAQRQMENLDRGVAAVRNAKGQIFVSWRLLATENAFFQCLSHHWRW